MDHFINKPKVKTEDGKEVEFIKIAQPYPAPTTTQKTTTKKTKWFIPHPKDNVRFGDTCVYSIAHDTHLSCFVTSK